MNSWPGSAIFSEFIFGNVETTRSWCLFIKIQTKLLEKISKVFETLVFNISSIPFEDAKYLWNFSGKYEEALVCLIY